MSDTRSATGFCSYAGCDDRNAGGRLSQLRTLLKGELETSAWSRRRCPGRFPPAPPATYRPRRNRRTAAARNAGSRLVPRDSGIANGSEESSTKVPGYISPRVNASLTNRRAYGKSGWNSPAGLTAAIEDDEPSSPSADHTGSSWRQSQDFHRSGVRVSPVRSRAGDASVRLPCYRRSRRHR